MKRTGVFRRRQNWNRTFRNRLFVTLDIASKKSILFVILDRFRLTIRISNFNSIRFIKMN
ncbi:hypothetical protein LEP1GSC047_3022 [Leptospira inadai serovar Lyme str. 10]|uniref:Uncharacterized protein n=2 Tax=Leptospira inadai serovar Lyme TaxID=293084 RepID=V6HUQ3_9LEPT|nr:hypothetical protein LEP1GSC047_3022 [Leptospira inadai serovar Lyme str. 10]PNV75506.1 hypothetical protein BES34_007635 [Leptospira inadai serovar Lyme]